MTKLDIFFIIMTIVALVGAYLVRRHDKKTIKDSKNKERRGE